MNFLNFRFDRKEIILFGGSWTLNGFTILNADVNIFTYLDKSTISFILGTIVTFMGIIHYAVKIRNEILKGNAERKQSNNLPGFQGPPPPAPEAKRIIIDPNEPIKPTPPEDKVSRFDL
jgi:hypothetical protein